MLDDILRTKQLEVEEAKERLPFEQLRARVKTYIAERSFRRALTQTKHPALIAELKRKSPSKGMLRERFDPVSLAQAMQQAGASALSVLTDETYFGGHADFLRDAKQFTALPVLRKDFIIDPYQVYESALFMADAVLLIVRVLEEETLIGCMQAADQLGIEPLVEVHSAEELKIATRSGAHVIGINSRDLQTFTMNPKLLSELMRQMPAGKVVVAESGISTPEEVQRLTQLGVHALLIGESLMTAPDPGAKIRQLFHGTW